MASEATKRPRLVIDVSPDIRRRVKAQAALEDMTISEWLLGLIMDELEEENDVRLALERLTDSSSRVTLEEVESERVELERKGAL